MFNKVRNNLRQVIFLILLLAPLFLFGSEKTSNSIFDARFNDVRNKVIKLVNEGEVASMSIAVAKNVTKNTSLHTNL